MRGRIDQTELEDLKARTPLSDVFARFGVSSKGGPKARWANCCFHGEKTPSLKINDERGTYHCFGCGASGDHLDVLRELGGKNFAEAVEFLGGARLITAEERKAIEDRKRKWEEEERKEKDRTKKATERIFSAGAPIAGTMAEAYLVARGLPVVPSWTTDLRFVPDLPYRGFPDADADGAIELGKFPAMLAAIRDVQGNIIGVHRTYLDPQRPAKLDPPGDKRRNKAKKILGEQRGGMIRLSPLNKRLAIGEGIETSRAWFALGMGEGDIGVAAAVSLGNLSGSATGSAPHPKDSKRTVPNGMPDMDRPGLILPREVEEVTLIGDGDSDPYMTCARLLVAARRFRAAGVEVFVSMAPPGQDFADVLLSDQEAGS